MKNLRTKLSYAFYTLLSLVIYRIKRLFIKNKIEDIHFDVLNEDIHFDVLNEEEFDY
jgi:hypothetical protein